MCVFVWWWLSAGEDLAFKTHFHTLSHGSELATAYSNGRKKSVTGQNLKGAYLGVCVCVCACA